MSKKSKSSKIATRGGGGRKKVAPVVNSKFSADTFERLARDLQNGNVPLDRVTVTDDMQPGLRAIIRNTGLVSFHVNYDVEGARPYLKIGDHPEMPIADARYVAKVVRDLAAMGIDPQEGLHRRLIRELLEKGTKWRPE